MPAPSASVLDTFTYSNGALPGTSWTNCASYEYGDILSNQLKGSGTTDDCSYWDIETFGPDCEVFITVAALPVTAQGGIIPLLRMKDMATAPDGYGCRYNPSNTRYEIVRLDNGSNSDSGSSFTVLAFADATGFAAATNLADNGDFETDTATWDTAHTIARDTARAKFGAASLLCTYTTGGDDNAAFFTLNVGSGRIYTFSAWVYIPSDWDGGAPRIVHDTSFVGSTVLETVAADLGLRDQWQRIYTRSLIDGGDTDGGVIFRLGGDIPTTGRSFSIDGVEVVSGGKIGLTAVGDTLTMYADTGSGWERVVQTTDSSYQAAGYIGFWGRQATGAGDSTWRADDFGGGTSVPLSYKRLAGPALLTNTAATIYTSVGNSFAQVLCVNNPSGSTVNLTVSVGADSAGTRLFDAFPIEAGRQRDLWIDLPLTNGDVIQAFASTGSVLNVSINGKDD